MAKQEINITKRGFDLNELSSLRTLQIRHTQHLKTGTKEGQVREEIASQEDNMYPQ